MAYQKAKLPVVNVRWPVTFGYWWLQYITWVDDVWLCPLTFLTKSCLMADSTYFHEPRSSQGGSLSSFNVGGSGGWDWKGTRTELLIWSRMMPLSGAGMSNNASLSPHTAISFITISTNGRSWSVKIKCLSFHRLLLAYADFLLFKSQLQLLLCNCCFYWFYFVNLNNSLRV